MVEPIDDRSLMAQALSQGSHVTAISLMMVIPAIMGYFVDQRLNTLILFTGLGFVLGIAIATWQLVQFVRHQERQGQKRRDEQASDHVDGDR